MTAKLTVRLCQTSAVLVLLTAGCAITPHQEGNDANYNASFMNAWHTYAHCLSSKDPEAIVSDLRALNRFADTTSTNTKGRTFGVLPYSLPALPSRLAVDPAAMVSACADHGAELALSLEQLRGSAELLITAVEAQNQFKPSSD